MTGLPVLADKDFRRLARYIESELGIRMPEAKRVMLESRLVKRLRQLGLDDFSHYVDFVFSGDEGREELVHMTDAVTTNKTDFFREADHFDFLRTTILPQLEGGAAARNCRAWSAGCSTGEEPYTLAMVLEEYRHANPGFSWSIFATDLSTRVLSLARDGVYTAEQAEPVPPGLKQKYLLRSKNREHGLVRVKPELRSRVTFERLNFMDATYAVDGVFDVILCRNVIIYFERRIQEEILGKLLRHLKPGGWLILGHSETITGMNLPIRAAAPTIYRKGWGGGDRG